MPSLRSKPSISSLKPYVAGRSTEEVRAQYGLAEVVKLGSNENPLGTGEKAQAAAAAELARLSVYPEGGQGRLLEALAAKYGLSPAHVFAGNGSDEVLLAIAACYMEKGGQALVSENTFSQYECVSRIFEGEVVKVPLRAWRHDPAGFLSRLTPITRIAFLCNPNNPTGTWLSHQEMLEFLGKVPPGVLVVLDEAYAEFAAATDFPRSLELLEKFPNLLVLRTLSKIYGLAGLRIGYCLGDPALISELQKFRNFNPFDVNRVAQAAAVAALSDAEFFARSHELNRTGMEQVGEGLRSLGLEVLPSEANYLCFKVGGDSRAFGEEMARRGVIIRPLVSFGMPEWCRVTIGTPEQNGIFLSVLAQVLRA